MGVSSRVTGLTIRPRLSRVKAPSSGVTDGGAKTTLDVARLSPSSKNASPTGVLLLRSVGEGELLTVHGANAELAEQGPRHHAEDGSCVHEEFDLDRPRPRPSGVRDPHLLERDSHLGAY